MKEKISLDVFGKNGIKRVMIDNHPWWVAKDVCSVLGIVNPRSSMHDFDDDEKGVYIMDTPGGQQRQTIVSEPGLYRLILKSRKPEAKAFKRWLIHDVLPSIRKTGQYILSPESIAQHRKRPVQIENSKRANIKNYQDGGRPAVVDHNFNNCLEHTGKTPAEMKLWGRSEGLKSKQRTSGKEVARHLMKKAACKMSMTDELTTDGYEFDDAIHISTLADPVFEAIFELGGRPAELDM